MIAEIKPLAEVTQEAIQVLYKEIGVVDTVRFLNQFTSGYGNYTEEREQLFADLTVDEIIAQIKQGRKATTTHNKS
jgi:hypothetical protein